MSSISFAQSRPIANPLFTEIVVEDRFGVFFALFYDHLSKTHAIDDSVDGDI